MKMNYLNVIVLVLCIGVAVSLIPPDLCSDCFGCVRYGTKQVSRCKTYGVQYYKAKCGFWGWGRCTRSRKECKSYKTAIAPSCVQHGIKPGCRCFNSKV